MFSWVDGRSLLVSSSAAFVLGAAPPPPPSAMPPCLTCRISQGRGPRIVRVVGCFLGNNATPRCRLGYVMMLL